MKHTYQKVHIISKVYTWSPFTSWGYMWIQYQVMIHQPLLHRNPCLCFLLGTSFLPDFQQHRAVLPVYIYGVTPLIPFIMKDRRLFFFFKERPPVHTPVSACPDHPSEVPEKLIQDRFRKLGRFPEAFSSIHYKGTRTYNPPTDFSGLRRALEQQLENNTTRSPRHPGVIFKALKVSCFLAGVLLPGAPVGGDTRFSNFCQCWWWNLGRKERVCERKGMSGVCYLLNGIILPGTWISGC